MSRIGAVAGNAANVSAVDDTAHERGATSNAAEMNSRRSKVDERGAEDAPTQPTCDGHLQQHVARTRGRTRHDDLRCRRRLENGAPLCGGLEDVQCPIGGHCVQHHCAISDGDLSRRQRRCGKAVRFQAHEATPTRYSTRRQQRAVRIEASVDLSNRLGKPNDFDRRRAATVRSIP